MFSLVKDDLTLNTTYDPTQIFFQLKQHVTLSLYIIEQRHSRLDKRRADLLKIRTHTAALSSGFSIK